MADITNLGKQPAVSKIGNPKFRLYLADFNDVDVESWPVPADATIDENVLKTGKKWKYLDATSASIKPVTSPGESPYTGRITLTPLIEGVSPASLQWVYDNAGKNVVAVWERCKDGTKFIAGTPCSNGLLLTYNSIGAQDGGVYGISLQLQGEECSEPFYVYDVSGTDFPVEPDV
jgi:hypothetical protein